MAVTEQDVGGKDQEQKETRIYHCVEEEYLDTMDRDEYDSYQGQWIAIIGREVIAHGVSFPEVAKEATKKANGRPTLLERIPRYDENEIYIM